MAITFEKIEEVNKRVAKVEIKGKLYARVPARIQAFREMCPNGKITSNIEYLENGVVVIKATIADETGEVLATGLACEKESSSFINNTSYIENCETSAVGRALGMIGIGSEEQLASAEELANAIKNQGASTPAPLKCENLDNSLITDYMAAAFEERIGNDDALRAWILSNYKVDSIKKLTNKKARNLNDNWDAAVKASRAKK